MSRNAVIAVRVEQELLEDLKERSRKSGVSYSDAVRVLVINFINGNIKINPNNMEIRK